MYAVTIPLIFVVVLSLFEPMALTDWRRRAVELGWDFCVLSFGVIGAIASLSIAKDTGSAEVVLTQAMFAVAPGFACVGLIARLKPVANPGGLQALSAIFLGLLSLGFPTVLGLHARRQNSAGMSM